MTILRYFLFSGAIMVFVAAAKGSDRECTSRSLGSNVTYDYWESHGYWGVGVGESRSTVSGTEVLVSRPVRYPRCGAGLYEVRAVGGIYRIGRDGTSWVKVDAAQARLSDFVETSDPKVLYGYPDHIVSNNFSRSEDGAKTWQVPSFRIDGVRVQGDGRLLFELQAVSPVDPLTLFATVKWWPVGKTPAERMFPRYKPLGLYVSRDGGDSWTLVNSKINGMVFSATRDWSEVDGDGNTPESTAALALAPSNLSVMYGYAEGDIVKTTDAGKTWTALNLKQELSRERLMLHGMKADFANRVAFTREPIPASGKYGNADAGFADYYLRQLGLPRQPLLEIVVDPTNEDIVYVVAEAGIYRSLDGGKGWTLLDLGFDVLAGIGGIVIERNDPSHIFVGTTEGLYMSRDRGCYFESVIIPPDALQCMAPQGVSDAPKIK